MDKTSIFAIFIFGLLVVGIMNMYYSEVVSVHLCTNKEGLTTYVGKKAPDSRLRVGTCDMVRMTNLEMHNLRSSYRRMYH